MKRTSLPLLIALLLAALPARGQQTTLKELYAEIDQAISQSAQYVAAHEERIGQVHSRFVNERDNEKRLQLAAQLFELYRAFSNDSALTYIQQYIDLAEQLGRRQQADQARAIMAFQCSTVGLYTESLGILHGIDAATLTPDGQADYYKACLHVCGELAYYTRLPAMQQEYWQLQHEYRDSLLLVANPESEDYLTQQEQQLLAENRYSEALQVNDRRLARVKDGSRDFAIVNFYRSLILRAQGHEDEACRCLARSALADIRNAVMDQASLIELAERLNAEGDFDRSYRYIRFTWDANNRFNTRMRSWQITPILTVIENNYQNELHRSQRVMVYAMAVVSVLALLMLVLVWFVHRRNKQLTAARHSLTQANEQLRDGNSQLAAQATELQGLNAQLAAQASQLEALNAQLKESNSVKEEYIGRFMSLCSQYIDKLDDYRKMVNRKMKNKELDELFRISKSTELKEKELEELYENFDLVFLHLFPTFVDDFNRLLLPEYQVHPKDEHRLSTDLRIFALIRLGIEDSSKIAEFLHYSVNTIYNYRARTKNGAAGNRESFEREVKNLGRLV